MTKTNWKQVFDVAKMITIEAAKRIKGSFNRQLVVDFKTNPNDLVTEMDRNIEYYFKEQINEYFPHHQIIAEEGTGKSIKSLQGVTWIIDPIDGTINFVHQQRNFAISIGIFEDGIGKVGIIYDVMADELYYAISGQGAFLNGIKLTHLPSAKLNESLLAVNSYWMVENTRILQLAKKCRGTRSLGSAALEMAAVCANRIDGYISMHLSPWDFAGGAVIAKEVGALVTTVEGSPLNFLEPSSLCIAKEGCYEEIQKHLHYTSD